MSSLTEEIAKKEYDRLLAEIVSIQEEATQLARYAIILGAAICTAMLTVDKTRPYWPELRVLPLIISLLFIYRIFTQFFRMRKISIYLQTNYEKRFLHPMDIVGWETYLNRSYLRPEGMRFRSRWPMILFWILMALANIIIIFIFR